MYSQHLSKLTELEILPIFDLRVWFLFDCFLNIYKLYIYIYSIYTYIYILWDLRQVCSKVVLKCGICKSRRWVLSSSDGSSFMRFHPKGTCWQGQFLSSPNFEWTESNLKLTVSIPLTNAPIKVLHFFAGGERSPCTSTSPRSGKTTFKYFHSRELFIFQVIGMLKLQL